MFDCSKQFIVSILSHTWSFGSLTPPLVSGCYQANLVQLCLLGCLRTVVQEEHLSGKLAQFIFRYDAVLSPNQQYESKEGNLSTDRNQEKATTVTAALIPCQIHNLWSVHLFYCLFS